VASRPVVSNTSPLINLVGVDLLSLLPQLYGEVWIPAAVREEYVRGAHANDPDLGALPWLMVVPVTLDPMLNDVLDEGEAAAIALAVANDARALLLDDKLGRRVAASLDLPVVGTLGIVLAAKEHHLITAVQPVIDQMLAQGRHISGYLRAQVLRDANEAL
jgi:predicted nucleic acid-binding protein